MAFDFADLAPAAQVQAVYVAYYGRAADPAGRSYWATRLQESGGDLTAIIEAFGTSPEAIQRFAALDNEGAVRTLFQSLFNRPPDNAGLDFYVGELAAGRLSLQTIALDVLNGARNNDATVVQNKIAAGQTYTDGLAATDTPAAASAARAVVAGVDATDASLTAAGAAAETLTGQRSGGVVTGDVRQDGTSLTSLPSTSAPVAVGVASAGFLGVTDGEQLSLSADGNATLRAGTEPQAVGTIVIQGAGSSITTAGQDNRTLIGHGGDGVLLVADGGRLTSERLDFGRDGGRGEGLVEGVDTLVAVTPADPAGYRGDVRVGGAGGGYGDVGIRDGARFLAQDMVVGVDPGSTGVLSVSGTSTLLDLAPGSAATTEPPDGPFLAVARYGEGVLTIRDGGQVRIQSAIGEAGFQIGRRDGAEGRVVVDGPGSRLSVEGQGQLFDGAGTGIVGRLGDGDLVVSGGGTVILDADGALSVATAPSASGTVTVRGDGSVIDAGRALAVSAPASGDTGNLPQALSFTGGGDGTVVVADGGTLRAGKAVNDGITDIFIGTGGTLNVQDGGTLLGDVRNEGGSFEPGNSPGQARIHGDFTSTGDVVLEIDGRARDEHDRIDVEGAVGLGGTLVLDFTGAEDVAAGDRFSVLSAADGLDVADAEVSVVGLDSGLTARIETDASTATVTLEAG